MFTEILFIQLVHPEVKFIFNGTVIISESENLYSQDSHWKT